MLSIQTNPKTIINRTTTNRVIESIIIIVEWKNKMVNKHVLAIKSNYYITAETIKKVEKNFLIIITTKKKKLKWKSVSSKSQNEKKTTIIIICQLSWIYKNRQEPKKTKTNTISLLNDNQIKLDQIYKTKNSWSLIIQLKTISL